MLQFNGALSAETVSGELSDKFKVISPPSNRVEGNEMWKSFKLTFAFCVENCFMLADSNKVESEFEKRKSVSFNALNLSTQKCRRGYPYLYT